MTEKGRDAVLVHANKPTSVRHLHRPSAVATVSDLALREASQRDCRATTLGDDVMTGLACNSILQRFKLNGQTALITGAASLSPAPQ